ncbi:hypothetical protein CGC32_02955 [Helicobacter pylori]|uniref:hypothetical protein n=1 Tax=Helicobacter pylori TaxID=210 RepID=UPI000B5E7F69|nr:hypothetical protein [Helicobacter pylori]ASM63625.1 hypothetical protein CGC32_02955 [Helicobacter pylori]
MQLFEKWQSVTDAYKSFYEESEHLGLEVVTLLKRFNDIDNSLTKAGACRSFMKQNAEKAGVSSDAMLIFEYLIVELLKNGGFDG